MVRFVAVWMEIDPGKLEYLCPAMSTDCAVKLLTACPFVHHPNPCKRTVRLRRHRFQGLLPVRYRSILSCHEDATPMFKTLFP